MEVADNAVGARPLFRYFLDGSMRTTSAGHIVDTKRRFLPVFVAQIGVAATKLDFGVFCDFCGIFTPSAERREVRGEKLAAERGVPDRTRWTANGEIRYSASSSTLSHLRCSVALCL